MAKHGVIRTDRMFGTDVRTGLKSVKYFVSTTPTDIDNGNVVKLDGLMEGEREVYKAVAPTTTTDLKDVVILDGVEMMYDDKLNKSLDQYYNEAGKPIRGYTLNSGADLSLTKEALDGAATPAVGDTVELKNGTKLNVIPSATGPTASTTQVGSIVAIEIAGMHTYYVIHID